jgi:Ran GTPase-activating protein (RanGAP) involved in mRNA processing and transport
LLLGKGTLPLAEALSYGLGAHSKNGLTVLNLAGNKITDDIMRMLSSGLSRSHALKVLNLSDNVISRKGLDSLLHTLLLPVDILKILFSFKSACIAK